MEIRFSFLPESKVLLISDDFSYHADTIAKFNKLSRHAIPFDNWIRGIIKDKKLYLRTFYPFSDIEEKTGQEIKDRSFDLLFDTRKAILKALKTQGIGKPSKIAYNVTNDDLRGILTNI